MQSKEVDSQFNYERWLEDQKKKLYNHKLIDLADEADLKPQNVV